MLLIALSAGLTSCGHVAVYDKEVCADLGGIGAHCHHTLTSASRDIAKPLWDKERVGYFCMNSQGYVDAETAIDQLCTSTSLCDYKTREQITTLKKTMRHLYSRAQKAKRKAILDDSSN